MPSFFQEIKTPEGVLNFHFLRLFSNRGYIYYITVMDKELNPVNVELEEREGKWYIYSPQTPQWIQALEDQFCRIIRDRQIHRAS